MLLWACGDSSLRGNYTNDVATVVQERVDRPLLVLRFVNDGLGALLGSTPLLRDNARWAFYSAFPVDDALTTHAVVSLMLNMGSA